MRREEQLKTVVQLNSCRLSIATKAPKHGGRSVVSAISFYFEGPAGCSLHPAAPLDHVALTRSGDGVGLRAARDGERRAADSVSHRAVQLNGGAPLRFSLERSVARGLLAVPAEGG
ncbi:hypothetical protein OJAV_G00072640 [Oryzias javanicus]|uniref:Uncharacterized protein n=1 Tax=Oryzias javanicus TaxID=123683 RepID=A0A437D8K5_ORYJA|nr:hypothetical protein OJAV_G00072640 [Oryzias javanicus]